MNETIAVISPQRARRPDSVPSAGRPRGVPYNTPVAARVVGKNCIAISFGGVKNLVSRVAAKRLSTQMMNGTWDHADGDSFMLRVGLVFMRMSQAEVKMASKCISMVAGRVCRQCSRKASDPPMDIVTVMGYARWMKSRGQQQLKGEIQ